MGAVQDLRAELCGIESDLDARRYRPGTWERFQHALRRQPRAERRALSIDVSRLSRRLHARGGIRTLPVTAALVLECLGTVIAGVVFALALHHRSTLSALTAAALWATTFQPLIKVLTGSLLGIRYDYAYLHGVEPRFKMRYGTYLAAPRWARIAVHVSGMVGSPLAAWLVSHLAAGTLPLTGAIASTACWVMVLFNVLLFLSALSGRRRVGSLRLAITSGGVAGAELREAIWDS